LSGNGLGVSFPGAVFSFTHKSNRDDGEKFETNIKPRTISSSTFLIPPNGVLSVDLQLKTSTRVEGQYAARALEMVSAAVGTVAPKIKFVNELNKPNLRAAAAELDKGISKLQSDNVDETATAHFNLSTWTLKRFATGEFRVPWDVSVATNEVLDDMVRVGSWKIYLKCPRVSLFSERNICVDAEPSTSNAKPNNTPAAQENFTPQEIWEQKKKVARELSNREILNFKIAPDKTIGEFAKAQTWYQDWLNDRKQKPIGPSPIDDTVKPEDPKVVMARDQRFCDNAAHNLGTAGQGNLSAFDAGMAVRSLINDMPDFVDFKEQVIEHCKDLVRFRVPSSAANAGEWKSLLQRPAAANKAGRAE
jgi:hypothetical protein